MLLNKTLQDGGLDVSVYKKLRLTSFTLMIFRVADRKGSFPELNKVVLAELSLTRPEPQRKLIKKDSQESFSDCHQKVTANKSIFTLRHEIFAGKKGSCTCTRIRCSCSLRVPIRRRTRSSRCVAASHCLRERNTAKPPKHVRGPRKRKRTESGVVAVTPVRLRGSLETLEL